MLRAPPSGFRITPQITGSSVELARPSLLKEPIGTVSYRPPRSAETLLLPTEVVLSVAPYPPVPFSFATLNYSASRSLPYFQFSNLLTSPPHTLPLLDTRHSPEGCLRPLLEAVSPHFHGPVSLLPTLFSPDLRWYVLRNGLHFLRPWYELEWHVNWQM